MFGDRLRDVRAGRRFLPPDIIKRGKRGQSSTATAASEGPEIYGNDYITSVPAQPRALHPVRAFGGNYMVVSYSVKDFSEAF